MGCGISTTSSYVVAVSPSTGVRSTSLWPWIAEPSTKFGVITADSFDVNQTTIGKGKFGNVVFASHKSTSKYVAIKYIPKQIIFETCCLDRLRMEAEIVSQLSHPFIVRYFGGFRTPACLAFVFELAIGGELYTRMKYDNRMPENHMKFYAGEISLALHYLHDTLHIVFRDLKPENIVLDCCGHVKLVDFGFAVYPEKDGLTDGCGTAMYLAPEVAGGFMKMPHSFPVDWWGLGCIMMEMITGKAPFGDSENMSKFEIFNNINEQQIRYPVSMSTQLTVLMTGLLDKNASTRFRWSDVKASVFFAGVDWDALYDRKIAAPWIPPVEPQPCVKHFVKWRDKDKVPTVAPSYDVSSYSDNFSFPSPLTGEIDTDTRVAWGDDRSVSSQHARKGQIMPFKSHSIAGLSIDRETNNSTVTVRKSSSKSKMLDVPASISRGASKRGVGSEGDLPAPLITRQQSSKRGFRPPITKAASAKIII